jgi:hypothetical protein
MRLVNDARGCKAWPTAGEKTPKKHLTMSDKSRTDEATRTLALLVGLHDLIDREKWSLDRKAANKAMERPWGGADVIVCHELPEDVDSSQTYVVSPYVVELTWLIKYLQAVCTPLRNFGTKYAFYGRLADAANRYMRERPVAQQNAKDLCFSVLRAAMEMFSAAEQGNFSSVRHEVQIKGIWIQLHPGADPSAAGLAVYRSSDTVSSLASERFEYQGKTYRIGETVEGASGEDGAVNVAPYHEAQ